MEVNIVCGYGPALRETGGLERIANVDYDRDTIIVVLWKMTCDKSEVK